MQHAADVQVSRATLEGKGIVIVGGGMTGVQLALAASSLGAQHVTLVCRHAITAQLLECQVSWPVMQLLKSNAF